MTRRMIVLVTFGLFVCGLMPVSAHDEVRLIGTVVKTITRTVTSQRSVQLDMKTKAGKTVSIALDAKTIITRDKKPVSATELKAGTSVVVDALGDLFVTPQGAEAWESLVAVDVKIVPAPASAAKK